MFGSRCDPARGPLEEAAPGCWVDAGNFPETQVIERRLRPIAAGDGTVNKRTFPRKAERLDHL